jgi:phospholipid N-methyltransferase
VNDRRLRPHHGSAGDAVRIVRSTGCLHGADVIFSSLGLALMSDALRAEILSTSCQLLRQDGTFVQYTYPHARLLTYQFQQGWSQFDGQRFLRHYFRNVDPKLVLANIPPAVVLTCREARIGTSILRPPTRAAARHRRRRLAAGQR